MNIDQARFNMVEQQVRPWEVLDPATLETLSAVPREAFVPPRYARLAFADLMLPLAHDQVMMRPVIEGRMLQALAVEPGESVLEIGTGSGFIAACLGQRAARVTSVDCFADLTARAGEVLAELKIGNVELATGDVMLGWRPAERFDALAVTASAPYLPEHFLDWLKPGGRMFIIIGEAPLMHARLYRLDADRRVADEDLFETDLKPLVHCVKAPTFEF
mgnify:CR=1 FL=1